MSKYISFLKRIEENKREILIAAAVALLLLVFLAMCGRGKPKEFSNALSEAGAYRGSLVLSTEFGIRLDLEELPEGYRSLVEGGAAPKIRREMTLDVMENLESGLSTMTGSIFFEDSLGKTTAETAFAGEKERFSLFEGGNWGSAKLENSFLAFFSEAYATLSTGDAKEASPDKKGCKLYEKVLKNGDELLKKLVSPAALSAETEVPVKLWVLEDSGKPYQLEADVSALGDPLLANAFAQSWVDAAWFSLDRCILTFTWTEFGSADGMGEQPQASVDVAIPDSALPALLYTGSLGLYERRNENLEMLDQLLLEESLEEAVPADDTGFTPEDDVEELSDPDESLWMSQGDHPGWLQLSLANVGSVGLTVPEGYRLSGFDESFAEIVSADADARERVADYYLEGDVTAAQVETDVCSPEGFSGTLGYRDVEIGSVQSLTVNGINWQWRGAVYALAGVDGTIGYYRDVCAWSALGSGVVRMQLTVTCGSIEEAISQNAENLAWEFLGLVSPAS